MQRRTLVLWLLPGLAVAGSLWLVDLAPRGRGANELPRLSSGPGFPVRLVFPRGAAVEIPGPPQRILLANANMVDIVTRLVPAERVLALPEQALTWSRLCEVDDGFREKATFRQVSSETILALEPDLVLCSPFNSALATADARAIGMPIVSLPQPADLDELVEIVRIVGRVVGADASAAGLCDEIAQRAQRLRGDRGQRSGLGALTYSNFGGSGWSAGAATMADAMLQLAGLRNLTADAGRRGEVRLLFEDLVALDPDIIVIPERFGEASSGTEAVLRSEPTIRDVRAVRNGRLVRLHPRFFSAGSPEILTAAETLAGAVERALAPATGGRRD
jgi:iron complex transport system substrate-binding protein